MLDHLPTNASTILTSSNQILGDHILAKEVVAILDPFALEVDPPPFQTYLVTCGDHLFGHGNNNGILPIPLIALLQPSFSKQPS